jgi:hypothetical protein
MSKAIYFAGVSRLNGELKFRTAQSPARFQQLTKLGDTEVEMTKVDADSKEAAAQELLDRNFANGRVEILALLTAVAGKKTAKRQLTVRVPTKFAIERQGKKVTVTDKKLSIDEANARVLATLKEITPERELELLCNRMPKKRRSRKAVEAV